MVSYSLTDTVGGDLPFPLGGGTANASGVNDTEFDVFLGGLSLNLHITKDNPYRRETAEWRKQQFDAAPDAGEQTLSSWWVRSQMSFHGGAGIKYLDTTAGDAAAVANRLRFSDSRGVDVWTPGELKRLPDTSLLSAVSGAIQLCAASSGGEDYLLFAAGSTLKAHRRAANDVITYTVTGMAGTVKSLVTDGAKYYLATSDGKIFSGPVDNSVAGAALWTGITSTSYVTLGWTKQRLMAGIDNKVYELAGAGGALPTAVYTHASASWRWTAWSDAPAGILGAGKNGLNSAIFSFNVHDGTGAPVLQPGVSIAEMPVGETVETLYLYVGSKLAIGTTAGLRVGEFSNFYGTFTFGPLSVRGKGTVTAIAGRGPYLYCAAQLDGEGCLIRVDLGMQVEEGPLYAWAPDLRSPDAAQAGPVNGITVRGDGLLAFAVQNYGVVAEAATFTGRSAWLQTARIRMNTVEPKAFKYASLRTEGAGHVVVSAATNLQAMGQVFEADTTADTQRFSLPPGAGEWVQLQFDFTGSGKVTSYQALALPAQPRQRLFSLPVQIFDSEKNRHNRVIGYQGRAKFILDNLERIESSGDEVAVQCPVLGIDAVRCTVERIEFQQLSPPVAGKSYGLGGYANLVMRTST